MHDHISSHNQPYALARRYSRARALGSMAVLATHTGWAGAWLIMAVAGNALATLVLAGVLAGHAQLPISGGLLLAAAGLGALMPALTLVRQRRAVRVAELVALALGLAGLGGMGLALAWPALLPLGLSVDAVHHSQLVDWLARYGTLPPIDGDTRGLLGEMNAYPIGFALVVVALARATGWPVLEMLYPTAALIGALIGAMVVALAATVCPPLPRGRAGAALGALALLAGPALLLTQRTFFMDAYIDHSYYTMVLGVFLTLLAFGWACAAPRWGRLAAAQFGLALAALLATYPLWAPLPAALAGFGMLAVAPGRLAPRGGHIQRGRRLARVALAFGPALLIGLIDLLPRLGTGQAVLAHQGLVAAPTAGRLIPIGIGLACTPLLLGTRPGRRLALGAALVLGATLVLGTLALAGQVASYHAYKVLFLLTPLAATLLSAGAARLVAYLPQRPVVLVAAAGTLGLALATSLVLAPPHAVQLLSPEVVAAARWLRANDPQAAARAIVVGRPHGLLAYWVHIGLLGHRRDQAGLTLDDLTAAPLTPESWLVDPRRPALAIGPVAEHPLPGITVLARFGDTGVLRRADTIDTAALNPLTIRYRTFWEDQRVKTAIELQRPEQGPLPTLELCLYQGSTPINRFALAPDQHRTRTQYLGVDLLPGTLSGQGYINTGDYPIFAAAGAAPTGDLRLTLRLLLGGTSVDERQLATFTRTADGQITQLVPGSGELIYLRHDPIAAPLRELTLDYGDALRLSGWNAPSQAAPGAALPVDLRWQAQRPIERALFPELLLLDPAGRVVAGDLAAPQDGFYPTWRWRVGEPVAERRTLQLPPDLAPGVYWLSLRVHDFAAQTLLGSAAADAAGQVQLGPLVVQ